ncbi:hypothetical protein SAMN05444722_3228 [Rhodovulum sp. ES.010]|uniref:hypothetical protein n=1 Tax=Rhodovulum sp. ES.010 TaxID=1882821 RepID=UPI0009260F9C|nr:hypothetical protein [Rhodovulum sp. ES.010]SIO53518.1 hypothetical protein SAMN05444722_3228 [Rhodovulum sp. ES.010]
MPDPADAVTEGRLLALRQLLVQIAAGHSLREILAFTEDVALDGQEDPGAVPSEAFAVAQALADEKRAIARALRQLVEAG